MEYFSVTSCHTEPPWDISPSVGHHPPQAEFLMFGDVSNGYRPTQNPNRLWHWRTLYRSVNKFLLGFLPGMNLSHIYQTVICFPCQPKQYTGTYHLATSMLLCSMACLTTYQIQKPFLCTPKQVSLIGIERPLLHTEQTPNCPPSDI